MSKRILVILGHPSQNSLCAALAQSYTRGAEAAGTRFAPSQLGELRAARRISGHLGYTSLVLPLGLPDAGHNQIKRTILELCGGKPVTVTNFGPVKSAGPKKRERWFGSGVWLWGEG